MKARAVEALKWFGAGVALFGAWCLLAWTFAWLASEGAFR